MISAKDEKVVKRLKLHRDNEMAYFINRMKKKEKPVTAWTIILLISLTIFTLDVASTIVLFIIDTKSRQKMELKD